MNYAPPATVPPGRIVSSISRLAVVLGLLLLAACATTGGTPAGEAAPNPPAADDARDPLEGFNRAMYAFNDKFDQYVFKPVAKGYRAVLPSPVRAGVSNFFSNLREPIVAINDLLQAKPAAALSDLTRFLTNTTIGILGLFDPASAIGLTRHQEDFGQTLGVWGVGEGPYIVWPFYGPSTLRDTGGDVADWHAYPPNYYDDEVSEGTRNTLLVVEAIDKREKLLDVTDILEQAGGRDPYVFVREAYRQRRTSQVYDGNPPREVPSGLFEDEEPPAPAGGKAPPAP